MIIEFISTKRDYFYDIDLIVKEEKDIIKKNLEKDSFNLIFIIP
jgi:hypothetical protein